MLSAPGYPGDIPAPAKWTFFIPLVAAAPYSLTSAERFEWHSLMGESQTSPVKSSGGQGR